MTLFCSYIATVSIERVELGRTLCWVRISVSPVTLLVKYQESTGKGFPAPIQERWKSLPSVIVCVLSINVTEKEAEKLVITNGNLRCNYLIYFE